MDEICFSLVRQTDKLTDADVDAMAAAIQNQLRVDVCPVWDLDGSHIFVERAGPVLPPNATPVLLLDASNPDSLGVHNFGGGSQIFVGGIMANGGKALTGDYSVSSVVSHEIIEALIDPRASNVDASGYAFEVCDPVQANWYLGQGGVAVSDFVFPVWFNAEATSGPPMDHLAQVERNHELAPGGYAVRQEPSGRPQLVYGAGTPPPWRIALAGRLRKRLTA